MSPGSENAEPGIAVEGLEAGYGDRGILNDVSLALAQSRVTVLLGPGGSGKTTFIQALLGQPFSEDFWHRGEVSPPATLWRVQPQMPAAMLRGRLDRRLACLLVSEETPREGVAAAARSRLDAVWPPGSVPHGYLEPFLEAPVSELEPWRHRLAAFSLAISEPACLYVFDEPDAELPADALAPLADRIEKLRENATILLVTHNLELAKRVADDVVLIVDGEIIEIAPSRIFFEQPRHPRSAIFVRLGS